MHEEDAVEQQKTVDGLSGDPINPRGEEMLVTRLG